MTALNLSRPVLVTCLCVLGFVGCLLRMYLVLAPALRQVRPWYPSFISIATLFLLVCLYGLWMMRRWSAWTLGVYLIATVLVQWSVGLLETQSLALAAALSLTSVFYYRKMN